MSEKISGLREFSSEVSRRAESAKDKLDQIDAQAVLASAFEVLCELPSDEAMKIICRGMCVAKKKIRG